jgi:hypothetical protein
MTAIISQLQVGMSIELPYRKIRVFGGLLVDSGSRATCSVAVRILGENRIQPFGIAS